MINRVLPALETSAGAASLLARELSAGPLGGAAQALADISTARADDESGIDDLATLSTGAVVSRVPMLDEDVHDLSSLTKIAAALTGGVGR